MGIDFDKLRDDLENDSLAAYFGGGFGGALMDVFDAKDASEEELLKMAAQQGFDISKYEE